MSVNIGTAVPQWRRARLAGGIVFGTVVVDSLVDMNLAGWQLLRGRYGVDHTRPGFQRENILAGPVFRLSCCL